jgi:polyisoprenoid-binding protein YceI
MKTIKFLTTIILLGSISLQAQNYRVDVQNSKVTWLGTKVTGKHYGTIALKSGEFILKSDKFISGTFVIDMNSIVDEDLTDAGYNQKLVGHLKSDDFFGVATYPESTLSITSSSAFKDNKATVQGNLTIKGKTNPISIEVARTGLHYQAKIVIDRAKYEIKYGSKTFFNDIGDKAISDEFTLDANLIVIPK